MPMDLLPALRRTRSGSGRFSSQVTVFRALPFQWKGISIWKCHFRLTVALLLLAALCGGCSQSDSAGVPANVGPSDDANTAENLDVLVAEFVSSSDSGDEAARERVLATGASCVPALLAIFPRAGNDERRRILELVADLGPQARDCAPLLIESLNSEQESIRDEAVRAVEEIGPAAIGATSRLIALLADEPSDAERRRLERGLLAVHPEGKLPVPVLLAILGSLDGSAQGMIGRIDLQTLHRLSRSLPVTGVLTEAIPFLVTLLREMDAGKRPAGMTPRPDERSSHSLVYKQGSEAIAGVTRNPEYDRQFADSERDAKLLQECESNIENALLNLEDLPVDQLGDLIRAPVSDRLTEFANIRLADLDRDGKIAVAAIALKSAEKGIRHQAAKTLAELKAVTVGKSLTDALATETAEGKDEQVIAAMMSAARYVDKSDFADATEVLAELSYDETWNVVAQQARDLLLSMPQQAIPRLIAILEGQYGSSKWLANETYWSIRALGDFGTQAGEAAPILIDYLRGMVNNPRSPKVEARVRIVVAMIDSLRRIDAEQAAEVFATICNKSNEAPEVIAATLDAIAETDAVFPLLAPMLDGFPNERVAMLNKWRVARGLEAFKTGGSRGVPVLVSIVNQSSSDAARANALTAIRRIGTPANGTAALLKHICMNTEETPDIRRNAFAALVAVVPEVGVEMGIEVLENAEASVNSRNKAGDFVLVNQVFEGLAGLGPQAGAAVPTLIDLFNKDLARINRHRGRGGGAYRRVAGATANCAKTLGRIGAQAEQALPMLRKAADSQKLSDQERQAIQDAIASIETACSALGLGGNPTMGLRSWKSADGSTTIEAVFLEYRNGEVRIRRQDGKEFNVSLGSFSEEDRKWVLERVSETE